MVALRLWQRGHWVKQFLAVVFMATFASLAQAQRPMSRAELERRTQEYLGDSTIIDTISKVVPADSLRVLYRALLRAPDPVVALRELRCESFSLWRRYGYGARLAEGRIRAEEWLPASDSIVVATLDSALHQTYPTEASCGIEQDEPRVIPSLRYPPFDPRARPSTYAAGTPRDSMRNGATFFEGTYRVFGRGRDTTVDLAGSAQLEFARNALKLRLEDRSRPGVYGISVTLIRTGLEHLARGSYPVLGHQDAFGIPNTFVVYNHIRTALGLPEYDMPDRVWGTVWVERADTNGASGRLEIRIASNVLADIHRLHTAVYDTSRGDTIAIAARFRATFGHDRESWSGIFGHVPPFPHRMPSGAPPDAAKTNAGLFLDEQRACESLPIWPRHPHLEPLPAGSPVIRAALDLTFDPRPRSQSNPWGVRVLSTNDTSGVRYTPRLRDFRFEPTARGEVTTRVRCTLTLRPAR